MKKVLIAATLLVLCLTVIGWAQDVRVAKVTQNLSQPGFVGYVPNEFVVQFKPAMGKAVPVTTALGNAAVGVASLDALANKYAVTQVRKEFTEESSEKINGLDIDLSRYHVVHFEVGTLDQVMAAYKADPMVESVEPIGIHTCYATPNDGFYPQQWHLNRANDHDIDAPEAWDIWSGSNNIIVAMMDTGVRYYHKDLGGSNASSTNPTAADGNMWINTAEKNGVAGVDDDGDGYVDDFYGWDFVTGVTGCWTGEDCSTADNDPRDFNGHGTHCAGNIAAINNNGYATCAAAGGYGNGTLQPTANGVKVMALRIGYSGSSGGQEVGFIRMDFAAQAFNYARLKGAKIASCSWGSSNSGGLGAAIDAFTAAGGLVFKAAGNDGTQTADYMDGRADVIAVAATDTNDCKADFSTYGTWVDISAPGTGIESLYHVHTDPANDYVAILDGTSMATPIAASVAALIWSKNPTWTSTQVRDRLFQTADPIDALPCNTSFAGKLGAGRVNAYKAVNQCSIVANFSGTPTSGCTPLNVNFTDASTGGPTNWSWTFGDGGTSTAQSPSHQYAAVGTYTVSLTAGNGSCNNTMTKTNYVTVTGAPTANFVGAPTTGNAPLSVTFTDQSTGGATGWSWNFGDAGTSTAQNPVHSYTAAGTYTVSLTASNACGSNQLVRSNYITVNTAPPQQCDDFSDNNISNWGNSSGTWTVTGGIVKGNSTTIDARRTSPFGSFTNPVIDADVRMNTGRNQRVARIIFSYVNANTYRFIEGDDANNWWRIYERTGGTNTVRATFTSSISTATFYHVTVTCTSAGNATLAVNGVTLGSYNFGTAPSGLVGIGYSRSNSDFDNFCVGANPLAIATVNEALTNLAKSEPLPAKFELGQNYPNPFNPTTTIKYMLPEATSVDLSVFNLLGQKVRVLANGYQGAGEHSVSWDGRDSRGISVASGIYLYKLSTEGFTETRKMLLMK